MSIRIDDELHALFGDGVAVVIGTRDAACVPEVTRGWGLQVGPDRSTIDVCVGLPSSDRTLKNLAANGRAAVTCVRPSDYRQVQVKGRLVGTLEPTAADREQVARHQAAFTVQVGGVGILPHLVPRFWNHDEPGALVKLRIRIEELYDQTPGPHAGRAL